MYYSIYVGGLVSGGILYKAYVDDRLDVCSIVVFVSVQ